MTGRALFKLEIHLESFLDIYIYIYSYIYIYFFFFVFFWPVTHVFWVVKKGSFSGMLASSVVGLCLWFTTSNG